MLMRKKHKKAVINQTPHRNEIWMAVDYDKKHNYKKEAKDLEYNNSVQRGTRLCIVVSNDEINNHGSTVEIVYVTTKRKNELPTHFITESTPRLSTVLCEQIITVPKRKLIKYYGELYTQKEIDILNNCLAVSIRKSYPYKSKQQKNKLHRIPCQYEVWWDYKKDKHCIVVSNDVGNYFAPVVEIVYIKEGEKNQNPAHFITYILQKPSLVLCDAITTIPKKNLKTYYGTLTQKEKNQLDKCLKVSLNL